MKNHYQEGTPGAPGAAAEVRSEHVGIVQGVQNVHALAVETFVSVTAGVDPMLFVNTNWKS